MTSSPIAPAARRPEEWLLPDLLTDAGADFVVDWQVEDRMQQFAPQPRAEGRKLS